MDEFKILTIGQKIKAAREKLQITQQQLAGSLHKTNISYLENNHKAMLNEHKALIISEAAQYWGRKRHIDMSYFTQKFLLEDENTQIIKYIKIEIDKLKSIIDIDKFENNINILEKLIDKYCDIINNELKYSIFKIAYNKFYDNCKFYKSKTYIVKCIEILNKEKKDSIVLVVMLIKISGQLRDYHNVIAWGKTLQIKFDKNNAFLKTIHYDIAKAYKKLNQIDNCINQIRSIDKIFNWDEEESIQIKILYAECLKSKGEYIKVENIYNKLLNKVLKTNFILFKVIIYANLSELFVLTKDIKKALTYIKKALQYENIEYKHKKEIQGNVYYDAFVVFTYNEDNKNIYKYFCKTINDTNDIDLITVAYMDILKYCMDKNIDKLIYLILDKLEENPNVNNKILSILMYVLNYFKNKKTNNFNYIFSQIFNINKNITEK